MSAAPFVVRASPACACCGDLGQLAVGWGCSDIDPICRECLGKMTVLDAIDEVCRVADECEECARQREVEAQFDRQVA